MACKRVMCFQLEALVEHRRVDLPRKHATFVPLGLWQLEGKTLLLEVGERGLDHARHLTPGQTEFHSTVAMGMQILEEAVEEAIMAEEEAQSVEGPEAPASA